MSIYHRQSTKIGFQKTVVVSGTTSTIRKAFNPRAIATKAYLSLLPKDNGIPQNLN